MILHFAAVIAGVAFTLWSTVITQYHELRGTPVPEPKVQEARETTSTPPTLITDVVSEIVKTKPATVEVPKQPQPKPAPSPNVPFTPLPIPTQPVITTPTVPVPSTPAPDVETNLSTEAFLKAAVVNVICVQGGGLKGVSGSGVIIDPRGIIVTVAHVGQNFLLTDYPEDNTGTCYIRTGSPAKNAYYAEIVYIPSKWVNDNDTTFLESRPKGTGENDFAFLVITGSATSAALPRSFPYIPMSAPRVKIEANDQVGVGSYAAEFLTNSQIRSSLYPTISFAPVNEVYTFSRSTEDVVSVHAGAASQEGSSGGAVINEDKQLIGLITTRTSKADLSLRDLQAITMDHLRRSFKDEMNTDLDFYFKNNSTISLVSKFESKRIELLGILVAALERARN